jgi:hypothetical protein
MRPTKQLPEDYHLYKTLDLSTSAATITLNLAAFPLLILFAWFFNSLIGSIRQKMWPTKVNISFTLSEVLILLLVILITVIIHELIHGLFYWIFTRDRPVFAFKGAYAYAAVPDWYIPRNQFVIVGLAPLVIVSLAVILLSPLIPSNILIFMIASAAFNAAGALGDMVIVGWTLLHPQHIYVCDHGDTFSLYNIRQE